MAINEQYPHLLHLALNCLIVNGELIRVGRTSGRT